MPGVKKITVYKRDANGVVTWHYSGRLVQLDPEQVILQARFNRDYLGRPYVTLKKNDLFIETYFFKRWYNIFEIHDREDDSLKGWYCNIARPAIMEGHHLYYDDLELDLFVSPDGRQQVLDQAEFMSLNLEPGERAQALSALEELQNFFREKLAK